MAWGGAPGGEIVLWGASQDLFGFSGKLAEFLSPSHFLIANGSSARRLRVEECSAL